MLNNQREVSKDGSKRLRAIFPALPAGLKAAYVKSVNTGFISLHYRSMTPPSGPRLVSDLRKTPYKKRRKTYPMARVNANNAGGR